MIKFSKCSNIVGCWKELERALSLENFLSSSRICTISWLAKISSSRMILKESCNNYVWCTFSEGNENLITIVLGNLFESNHYYIRYIHSESRPISEFSLFIIVPNMEHCFKIRDIVQQMCTSDFTNTWGANFKDPLQLNFRCCTYFFFGFYFTKDGIMEIVNIRIVHYWIHTREVVVDDIRSGWEGE